MTLVCYPNHFATAPLQAAASPRAGVLRFASVKHRLFDICMGALAVEVDADNLVMLLRATLLFVLDDEARRVIASSFSAGTAPSPSQSPTMHQEAADEPSRSLRKGSSLDQAAAANAAAGYDAISMATTPVPTIILEGVAYVAPGGASSGTSSGTSSRTTSLPRIASMRSVHRVTPAPPPLLVMTAIETLLANLQVQGLLCVRSCAGPPLACPCQV